MDEIEKKKSVTEEVNQSIMSIKNMINIIGGTTSKFNLEIPANVTDVEIEGKVIGIFSWVQI